MKKFNKTFKANETKVQLPGEYGFRNVKSVHESRNWIEIEGLGGKFQLGHINTYTNKASVSMFPALDDKYVCDQYGSVYERGDNENMFIGKLNGKTLKAFAAEYEI